MLFVDTGIFVAAADRDEPHHAASADVLRGRDLRVVAPVISETAWMIEARLGPDAEVRFLTLVNSDRFQIEDALPVDYRRSIELIRQYADLSLGFVDASIIAIAERLNVTDIATHNHRDFAVVRPAHCTAFELIP